MSDVNLIPIDDKIDNDIPTATNEIYKWIADNYKQFDTNVLRASAAAGCVRKRWYQHNGYKGRPMAPRAYINFCMGDLGEMVMAHWITQANVGEGKLYSEVRFGEENGSIEINGKVFKTYKQLDLHIPVGDLEVIGHADYFGKRNSDGKWELGEIKTASNFGYKRFVNGETILEAVEGYSMQAHALMLSKEASEMGVDSVRFRYVKKETANIFDKLFQFNEDIAAETVRGFVASVDKDIPNKPYELVDYFPLELKPGNKRRTRSKVAKGKTCNAFPCGYCPYLKECQGDFEIQFNENQWGQNTPLYIFNV